MPHKFFRTKFSILYLFTRSLAQSGYFAKKPPNVTLKEKFPNSRPILKYSFYPISFGKSSG